MVLLKSMGLGHPGKCECLVPLWPLVSIPTIRAHLTITDLLDKLAPLWLLEPFLTVRGLVSCNRSTLASTRHPSPSFAISPSFRAQGVGLIRPPRVWLLIELELWLKNQRVACHETKPLTPDFKVLGQPATSEVRSMTQNGQNATCKWPKRR